MHIISKTETLTFETKTFRTPQTQSAYVFLNFKFPVDCDAMLHVLKDFIIQKLFELLTIVILSES